MVFVQDHDEWKLVHEHLSPLGSPAPPKGFRPLHDLGSPPSHAALRSRDVAWSWGFGMRWCRAGKLCGKPNRPTPHRGSSSPRLVLPTAMMSCLDWIHLSVAMRWAPFMTSSPAASRARRPSACSITTARSGATSSCRASPRSSTS
jgi:hypothetical protein